jgi:hypothetical protein
MTASDFATVVLSVVASVGLIVALVRWFFTRGASEQSLTQAVADNSSATRELTARIDSFMARYEERHETLVERVSVHDTRIGVAETRIRANGLDIARLWPSPGQNAKPSGDPHPDLVPVE